MSKTAFGAAGDVEGRKKINFLIVVDNAAAERTSWVQVETSCSPSFANGVCFSFLRQQTKQHLLDVERQIGRPDRSLRSGCDVEDGPLLSWILLWSLFLALARRTKSRLLVAQGKHGYSDH